MKKITSLLISTFLFCTISYAQGKKLPNTTTNYYEKSDLVGDLEIDTGKSTVFRYFHSDMKFTEEIYIKVNSLDSLITNKQISTEESCIDAYYRYSSCYNNYETNKISGTILKTKGSDSIQTLDLKLNYTNNNGELDSLLRGQFYFKKTRLELPTAADYNGSYDNLRIALKEPTLVQVLDLSYEGVWKYQKNLSGKQELPTEVGKLKNLEELDLHLQDLKYLPNEFKNLTNLRILDISYNNFESFPTEIFSCNKLDSLNLKLSRITNIPNEIKALSNLKKIILDDNRLTGFPKAITNLFELREISITNGNINVIPKEIGKLTKLERLDVGNFWNYHRKNKCDSLENIAQLKNLKELNLEWTKIKYLPAEFSELNKLETLIIKYNDFKSFPEVIDQIPNLKLLIISHVEFNKRTMKELKKQNKKYRVQIDTT